MFYSRRVRRSGDCGIGISRHAAAISVQSFGWLMPMRRYYFMIAFAVFLMDQVTKWLVVTKFTPDTNVRVIPGLFSLVWVENRGIAFGLLGGISSGVLFKFIVVASGMALCLVSYLLWKNDPAAVRAAIGLALILGGAGGNLMDRIARGRVLDFLDFYVGSYHWPAFNIADSVIVIGGGLLLMDLFTGRLEGIESEPVASPKAGAPTEPRP